MATNVNVTAPTSWRTTAKDFLEVQSFASPEIPADCSLEVQCQIRLKRFKENQKQNACVPFCSVPQMRDL
jgi:hypothetical protein